MDEIHAMPPWRKSMTFPHYPYLPIGLDYSFAGDEYQLPLPMLFNASFSSMLPFPICVDVGYIFLIRP
ncbi:hypothetical protein BU26DRAFT_571909 [Trematosphaeria pertusa]|uniref:Uncharacterized protein n=1 Tax=Trematosphaeria pertusa TaxID=390896 RepID=A0A6A6HVI4_9PLEO|nr:uncharacterized protein BU26DRAFT_571909 [Trematosphaeria pertusa]KAF2241430.1 hypothetical protein BU26DRAFT_571909 [Trematosphaeria pertusa]